MNDWTKLLMAAGAGAAAMHLYMNYQGESEAEARRRAYAASSPTQRLTQTALQAGRDIGLVPASQMNGMAGHMNGMAGHMRMPAPAQGFYGNTGMRQSGAGNPHAPVVVPTRPHRGAPPPPPPAPSANAGEGGEYENYTDDNTMGGQRF